MSATRTPLGLLTIPVEVRSLIYKALWAGTVHHVDAVLDNEWTVIRAYKGPESLALLQSCRKINEEALPVLTRSCSVLAIEDSSKFEEQKSSSFTTDKSNSESKPTQSWPFKNPPKRLLQALPYIQKLDCRISMPDWNAEASWLPIRDKFECLPKLEKVVVFDADIRATEMWFLDHFGEFNDYSVFTDKKFYQLLSEDLEYMISVEGTLSQALSRRKEQGRSILLEIQAAVHLEDEEHVYPLNVGYTTEHDLAVLHSHTAWMHYTYGSATRSFRDIRFGFDTESETVQWFDTQEAFIARVDEIKRNQEWSAKSGR